MKNFKVAGLPKVYHSTPVRAQLDDIDKEKGLIYYDGLLLSVRFYSDGRCELVSWVDTEMFDADGPAITTDIFLTCELDPEFAQMIVADGSEFSFGDVYLQPGVKFHQECHTRQDAGGGYVHFPVTRRYIGSFLNVPADHLPTKLDVELKLK